MKLKRETKTQISYWYSPEFCCDKLKDCYFNSQFNFRIYPNEDSKLLQGTYFKNKESEEYTEDEKNTGLSLNGEKINFCPFCGEKISE